MLDAAANTERIQLLGASKRKRRLFEGLGLVASAITIAGIAVGAPIAVALGVVGIALNVHRVRQLRPDELLLIEMAPERAAAPQDQRLEGTELLPERAA